VKKSYEDVKEGGVEVILQDLFLQLLLNATVHLPNTAQFYSVMSSGDRNFHFRKPDQEGGALLLY